jgi:hypothetical protein
MDTETVIAVGFVIHELLGLVGGLTLCYFGYRLLMRRMKVHPRETHGRWNSAKVLIKHAAPGTLFALVGAVAIWLTASGAFLPKTFRPKASVSVPAMPAKDMPRSTPSEKDDGIAMTLGATRSGMNASLPGNRTLAEDNSPTNQSPASTPVPSPSLSRELPPDRIALAKNNDVTDREPADRGRRSVDGERPRAGRKTLEKARREAERKRSRLEEMYQNHLISSEAYKKGEEEYKTEIEKYRSEVNAAKSAAE